jgi:putative FmdB family regulatory protein
VPLYDYDCSNCGRRFEIIHGVNADSPAVCPLCGGGPVRKAIVAPAVHFKGSGWAKKERRATAAPGPSKPAGDSNSSSHGSDSGGSSGSDGDGGSSGSSGASGSSGGPTSEPTTSGSPAGSSDTSSD